MTRVLTVLVCLPLGFAAPSQAGGPQVKDDKVKGPPAADLLADGLAKAKQDGRAVFLSFGSPTCGWCKYLEKYHARPAVEKTLARHLVFVKVDVVENPGGD